MKRPLRVIICFLCLFSYCFLFGYDLVSQYTIEEHVQRITERLNNKDKEWFQWGFPEGKTYESFEVYPLYDFNDQVNHYLVEFEPYGFTVIWAMDEAYAGFSCSGSETRPMYRKSQIYGLRSTWSPYRYMLTENNGTASLEKQYYLDEHGFEFMYNKSPYRVAQVLDEKKYLVDVGGGCYVCAAKKDGEYINLISGYGINIEEKLSYDKIETLELSYTKNKRHIL